MSCIELTPKSCNTFRKHNVFVTGLCVSPSLRIRTETFPEPLQENQDSAAQLPIFSIATPFQGAVLEGFKKSIRSSKNSRKSSPWTPIFITHSPLCRHTTLASPPTSRPTSTISSATGKTPRRVSRLRRHSIAYKSRRRTRRQRPSRLNRREDCSSGR